MRYAEATQGGNEPMGQIAAACKAILLSTGLSDEAYQCYALATFRTTCRKYLHKSRKAILHDLVASTRGKEGKWFAAAKDAKHYYLALQLAQKSPVDNRTLIDEHGQRS